jgi:hypothetical protein
MVAATSWASSMDSYTDTMEASSPITICTGGCASLPVISFIFLASPVMKRSLVT